MCKPLLAIPIYAIGFFDQFSGRTGFNANGVTGMAVFRPMECRLMVMSVYPMIVMSVMDRRSAVPMGIRTYTFLRCRAEFCLDFDVDGSAAGGHRLGCKSMAFEIVVVAIA